MQHRTRRARPARGLFAAAAVLSLVAIASVPGCDDATTTCTPGQSEACACTNGLNGAQVCRPDGSGFDACVCDGSGGSGSGTTTTTTTTTTSTATPTSSGTGGATPCTPGTTSACYEGPAGTEGKGICKGGMHNCLADMTFDACVGQVLPASEDCNTPEDEDCDGATPACPAAWTVVLGDDTMTQVNETTMALAPNGDVVVAGAFSGDITLGGMTHHASQFSDVFVARFTSNGDFVWFRQLPGLNAQNAFSIAVGPTGEIAVVGETRGAVDFGAGMQPVAGAGDGFVWKLNADGSSAWGKIIGSNDPNGLEVVQTVAIDANGNVALSGYVFGFAAIGTLELSGGGKYYYALIQPNGTPTWAFEYVGSPPSAAGFDSANDLYLAGGGQFIDFGAGSVQANVYAARFSPAGAVQSSKAYWNNNQLGLPFFGHFALQANGDSVRVIAISNNSPFDFGGGPAGPYYFALVGLDVQMQHEFTRGFMSFGANNGFSAMVGARPMKGSVIAGTFSGGATIDTSTGPLTTGAMDAVAAYFARVSPTGVITGGTTYPIASQCSMTFQAVTADATDRIYVSGTYNGSTCGGLGTGALPPALVRGFVSRLAW